MSEPRHMKPTDRSKDQEMSDEPADEAKRETQPAQTGTSSDGDEARGQAPASKALGMKIALVVLIAIALCGASYLVWQQVMVGRAAHDAAEREVPSAPAGTGSGESGETPELPDNPVNFSDARAGNNDIYAWLTVPGTSVNLPVLQSPTDDSYYLTHDADGNADPVGAAFTQIKNKTDFSDPVTVIYGHDVDSVFGTLHDFEDSEFLNANKTFYIYTPGHVLTYTVISAYQYDDRHILNSFDFSNADVRNQYFSYVQNPDSLLKSVNEDVQLNADSKIVQLSTCMQSQFRDSTRYIVTGVLTDDQQTK